MVNNTLGPSLLPLSHATSLQHGLWLKPFTLNWALHWKLTLKHFLRMAPDIRMESDNQTFSTIHKKKIGTYTVVLYITIRVCNATTVKWKRWRVDLYVPKIARSSGIYDNSVPVSLEAAQKSRYLEYFFPFPDVPPKSILASVHNDDIEGAKDWATNTVQIIFRIKDLNEDFVLFCFSLVAFSSV